MATFSERLRARRNNLGLTQEDLAGRTGFSSSSITAWERGVNPPTTQSLTKLAEALSCSAAWLLSGAPESAGKAQEPASEFRGRVDRILSRIALLDETEWLTTEPALLGVIDAVISARRGRRASAAQANPVSDPMPGIDPVVADTARGGALAAQRMIREGRGPTSTRTAASPSENKPAPTGAPGQPISRRSATPAPAPTPPSSS